MANYGGRGQERRNEIARAKGFRSYSEYRKASKADRERASRQLAARDVRYRATNAVRQVVSPPAKRRLHDLGGGRQLLRSTSNRELWAFLRRAEQADMRVFASVTVAGAGGPSEVTLWKRGGIDPSYILDELRAADSRDVRQWLEDYIEEAGGNAGGVSGFASGAVSMVTFSSGSAGEGIAA